MLFFFLGVSIVFLIFINAIAFSRERTGVGVASLCSLAGIFVLFFCTMSLILPLNALLIAVAGGVCWAVNARPRQFLASTIGATVAAYALITCLSVAPELREWSRLKRYYPVESLTGRLTYEDRARPAYLAGKRAPLEQTAARRSGRLARLEDRFQQENQRWDTLSRVRSLEHLHAGVVKQFIDSEGFGVLRSIRRPRTFYLEPRDEESPIPQPAPPYPSAGLSSAPLRVAPEPDLMTAHNDNLLDFLNPFRYGYVRDREHVVGFQAHQFRYGPRAPERWQVGRLELVGLLKYEEPVVYLSSNLPRMDELSKAPTRPLDAFEKKALEGLLGGEDLMVLEGKQRLRLLGSIRAVEQCVRCHRVKRGELLGAFSYQMSPE